TPHARKGALLRQALTPSSAPCCRPNLALPAEIRDARATTPALGGLVPRSDAEVRAVVRAVHAAVQQCKQPPWIHLLGIFRPSLQPYFRELGIGSFDSATYFRKVWLRSDQNYLGADGRWYAAIRVPPLRDPRTKQRLGESGVDEAKLRT